MSDYWIVRHKATNALMPQNRGHSWWEPVAGTSYIPRLFLSRRAANQSAWAWSRGRWTMKYEDSPSGDWFSKDVEFNVSFEPVEGRLRTDLEILPVTLLIGQ